MSQNRIVAAGAAAIMLTALMSGCSTGPRYQTVTMSEPSVTTQPYAADYGTVDSIQLVRTGDSSSGVGGTIAGGVVGGLLGNQVGSGTGRTAATIVGAVGGAAVGNEIDRRNSAPGQYQIGVRLDSGSFLTIVQDSVAELRVGDRVRIENGHVYRA